MEYRTYRYTIPLPNIYMWYYRNEMALTRGTHKRYTIYIPSPSYRQVRYLEIDIPQSHHWTYQANNSLPYMAHPSYLELRESPGKVLWGRLSRYFWRSE